jgi:hypothetical protein
VDAVRRRHGWLPVLGLFGLIVGVLVYHARVSAHSAELNERLFEAVAASDAAAVERLLRQGRGAAGMYR